MESKKTTISARDVISRIEAGLGVPARTLDTFKFGDPDSPVKGVAMTFCATRAVLARAAKLGANLIITHEPTFYNHRDDTDWLADDPVFVAKREIMRRHEIVVWRFHDGMHLRKPDMILLGVAGKLGWPMPGDPSRPNIFLLSPGMSLRCLAEHCRRALGIGPVRVAGDPNMLCSRIGLLPGAVGGRRQIETLMRDGADVIVCGESPEWETCEYVRDATETPRGLIVLGHANSEEAGMAYGTEWLRDLLPIPVYHIPAGDPFTCV